MSKKKILSVVGARPNFMKVAPIHEALCRNSFFESIIVHTGQHYDARMSDIFFSQLGLPKPHHYLGVEGGDSVSQISRVMQAFNAVLMEERPDLVLVVGDVNATAAAAITAAHLQIPVAHVEAGLRSFDRTMPEEINRMLTDSITNLYFVTEQSAWDNLVSEGVDKSRIFFVGNVMIDTLRKYEPAATSLAKELLIDLQLEPGKYVLMTMHRPSNVDTESGLEAIADMVAGITKLGMKVVWPVHPRTGHQIEKYRMQEKFAEVIKLPPQGYIEFVAFMKNARVVLTDSGGVQEETTCLDVPCITFRSTTERPVTVDLGTNRLMAELDTDLTMKAIRDILNGHGKEGTIPPCWDGKAASRIVEELEKWLI